MRNSSLETIRWQYEEAVCKFVAIQLKLVKTFCRIAKHTANSATFERSLENAEVAFQNAICALTNLDCKDNDDITTLVNEAGTILSQIWEAAELNQ